MADPVPVITHGFSWTAAGAWGTFVTALVGLITLIVRQVGPWRKQLDATGDKIRDDLAARVQLLEERLDAKDKEHKAELTELRHHFEARLQAKDVIHDAERALDRHEKNNLNACIEALFRAVRKVPELMAEAGGVETLRARQMEQEAVEKTRIRELRLAAARGGVE